MKYLSLLFISLVSASLQAQPGEDYYSDLRQLEFENAFGQMITCLRTDSVYRPDLPVSQSQFVFEFNGLNATDSNAVVQYSVDTTTLSGNLDSGTLSITTTPGYHSFQFFINRNYYEVFSGMLNIPAQHQYTYQVSLIHSEPTVPVVTYKPLIYLYPKEKTSIDLTIDIHDGKHPFFYPEYTDSWSCVANPDGTLEMNGTDYRYLFWEAEQADHLSQIEVNEGFIVAGSEAISFLEEKLTEVGFTSEERADFITFWGPKLAANENNLVRFEWNETCNKFADLNISPKPDHIYRFYIFMSAIDTTISIQPQSLPTFNREGFVALEWGGQISNYQPNTEL